VSPFGSAPEETGGFPSLSQARHARMAPPGDHVDHAVDVRVPEARHAFALQYSPQGSKLYALCRDAWDGWDEEDVARKQSPELRVFVSDQLFYASDGDDLGQMGGFWETLGNEARRLIIDGLESTRGSLEYTGTRLTLDPFNDAPLAMLEKAVLSWLDFGVWLGHELRKQRDQYRR